MQPDNCLPLLKFLFDKERLLFKLFIIIFVIFSSWRYELQASLSQTMSPIQADNSWSILYSISWISEKYLYSSLICGYLSNTNHWQINLNWVWIYSYYLVEGVNGVQCQKIVLSIKKNPNGESIICLGLTIADFQKSDCENYI